MAQSVNTENESVVLVDYRANKNLSEMQVSFHWWDAAYTTLHCHNYCEFFIITSGCTYHILNGVRESLAENTLYLIRPHDVHQFAPIGNEKCIHINLSTIPERFTQLCSALGISSEAMFDDSQNALCVELTPDERNYFLNRAQQVHFLGHDEKDRSTLQLTISEMLIQCIALMHKKRIVRHDGCPQWLRKVFEQLHTPEYMDCNANDVYQLAGYSAPVVIQNFKRYTGDTVRSYLVKLKMDWAMQLFLTTNMSVLEVSDTLGYASLSHFEKLFVQHTGKYPRIFKARKDKHQWLEGKDRILAE
ncbi:MAG: helix-turn-helix domain-containing protein [Anaerolineaceae bacterium]